MARKVENVIIDSEGRDKGKHYVITEMSATQGDRWASRLIFALLSTGIKIPANIGKGGMADVAALGMNALGKIPFETAEPLLEDLMKMVQIKPDPANAPALVRDLTENDIEEVKTRFKLKTEAFKLNINFLKADAD